MSLFNLVGHGNDPASKLTNEFYRLLFMDRLLWRGYPSESPRFERKQKIVDQLHEVTSFENNDQEEPLGELDADTVTRESFIEASLNFQRPVIVRGFAKNNPAITNWTAPYLKEKLGNQICTPLTWTKDIEGKDWDVCAKISQMTFAEFFERMHDEPIYINANTEAATGDHSLVEELDLGKIQDTFTTPGESWDELVLLNFFIGSSHVHSQLHTAVGGNFFLMINGRKKWTLMDPKYSAYIHPVTRRPYQTFRSRYGGYRAQRALGASADHPLFRPPLHEFVLEPGDLFYNAPWWWHEVENLDPFSVGVAVRHTPPPFASSPSWANQSLFTLAGIYPVGRSMTYAHWLVQKLTGYKKPLREILHPINNKAFANLYKNTKDDPS